MQKKKHVTIIGAGMGGCLLAIYLARRNFAVDIYESRDNIANLPIVSNRSINQSLTIRGITALQEVGLWETVKKLTLEEKGRVIHQKDGTLLYQPYGEKQGFAEWSINRNDLNKVLLSELRKYPHVKVTFTTKCTAIDFRNKTIQLENLKTGKSITKKVALVVGADGIHSTVRKMLEEKKYMQPKVEYLDWGYKNMYIPAPVHGTLPFKPHAFHCWPTKKAGIVGFPNSKGFFTCTLTLPLEGKNSFTAINTRGSFLDYFKKNFPDLYPFIPSLAEEFLKHKPTRLSSVYTSQWYYKDFVVLLGDACHAVTIFYGQGINSAFEDCRVLTQCIDQSYPDYEKAFATYQSLRKPHTDVLAALCKKRFVELKDKYASPFFIARSTLEMHLERLFPIRFQSLYTLIVFTTLPYSIALQRYTMKMTVARFLGIDIIVAGYAGYYFLKNMIDKVKLPNPFTYAKLRMLPETS